MKKQQFRGHFDRPGRTVLLDTIADAAAAAGVAVAGAIILVVKGWYWLDPAVALAIAAIVAWHALALTRRIIKRAAEPHPAW